MSSNIDITISGLTGSGKTTVLAVIERALAIEGFQVSLVPGLATEHNAFSRFDKGENAPKIARGISVSLKEINMQRPPRFETFMAHDVRILIGGAMGSPLSIFEGNDENSLIANAAVRLRELINAGGGSSVEIKAHRLDQEKRIRKALDAAVSDAMSGGARTSASDLGR